MPNGAIAAMHYLVLWFTFACPPLAGGLPVPVKFALCSPVLDLRAAESLEASHAVLERSVPKQSLTTLWKLKEGRWRLAEVVVK